MYNEEIDYGRAASAPLVPPEATWDPAEELAWMLQEAMVEQPPVIPGPRDEQSVTAPPAGSHLSNLQEITAELPPLKRSSHSHRRVRERGRLNALRSISYLIAAIAAVIASAVSFLSGIVAGDPLRAVAAARTQGGVIAWWPLLVYGPWLVASLSILRAALHRRRATHSWCVVVLFSAIAICLSVVQAPHTFIDSTAAALPGLAALACLQQAVRQITLTRTPRRAAPRHRVRQTDAPPKDQEPHEDDTPNPRHPHAP
ncbi:DUF2637 domain-containing protein [Streptomyces sp. B93]|uniref:DUF2637 domain-containing protein n=1 Tax=Streptomyces sp. B93 TaxID=2824875 RepID=UPI001B35D860|nr:DUF2637 domain-containing protein [Streptomyces sp. B93]MBQ1089546.1 DUF2637 domain-containing protein [Streptomyces sp. B93]